jgi:hypothetical protein
VCILLHYLGSTSWQTWPWPASPCDPPTSTWLFSNVSDYRLSVKKESKTNHNDKVLEGTLHNLSTTCLLCTHLQAHWVQGHHVKPCIGVRPTSGQVLWYSPLSSGIGANSAKQLKNGDIPKVKATLIHPFLTTLDLWKSFRDERLTRRVNGHVGVGSVFYWLV